MLAGKGEKRREPCKHCIPFEKTTDCSEDLSSFQIYARIVPESVHTRKFLSHSEEAKSVV
jgi:hypothetical protein